MAEDKIIDESLEFDDANDEYQYISVLDDDGTEIQCEILGLFDYNDKEYIALAPSDSPFDYTEVYFFGYEAVDEKSFDLSEIESDEEFDAVAEEFYRITKEFQKVE